MDATSEDAAVNTNSGSPAVVQKRKRLTNGSSDQQTSEVRMSSENGLACNGAAGSESLHESDVSDEADVSESRLSHSKEVRETHDATKSPAPESDSETALDLSKKKSKPKSSKETEESMDVGDSEYNCDNENIDGALREKRSASGKKKSNGEKVCEVKDVENDRKGDESNDETGVDREQLKRQDGKSDKAAEEEKEATTAEIEENATDKGSAKKSKTEAAKSEKDEVEETTVLPEAGNAEAPLEKAKSSEKNVQPSKNKKKKKKKKKTASNSGAVSSDKKLTGELKFVNSTASNSSMQNFSARGLPGSGLPLVNQNFSQSGMKNHLPHNLALPTSAAHGLPTGYSPLHGMPAVPTGFPFHAAAGIPGQGSPNVSMFVPSLAPPKPKSSLDQIELIRWEIQNRINTRPKYFKPNPASELGPLAKFLFDIGSDLIKEAVYHDLVKIQSKKNSDGKLNDKEKEDLEKLKEIEKDLYATVGHLKVKLKQRCKVCNFLTESNNVMYFHKQYPHEDNKLLRCAYCVFSTRQVMAFKFHLEAEHGVQPRLHDKKAFYECELCPYENNQEQKLTIHKERCIKQFRPLFNLHPSCLSGAEINLCLENIFYKPVIPKNLKILQQKHAAQQAALAEARRQQAEVQALAAQKNAAAVAAKKQQHTLQKQSPAPRFNAPAGRGAALPQKSPGNQQVARLNSSSSQAKGPRPTVASMLNNKSSVALPVSGPGNVTGGFEVCEICGGYVKDRKALRIHFFYAHRIDLPFNLFERNQAPLYCATCYVRFWTAQGLRKHIETHKEENQTRGVVGKCISCGHHVLNLLLHMRVVHNREMQHYISALMCMFCGGHFGSRQDCERHILKVHGQVDPVTGTLKSSSTPNQQQKASGNQKKPVNNTLVKGSVCVLCNLNFGRNVDLTRHCMRMHHTCMKCGMVVIDKASLMKHTCLSSPSGTRDCGMCGETGFHPAYYVKHLRDNHLKKFAITVAKTEKHIIKKWTKRSCPSTGSKVSGSKRGFVKQAPTTLPPRNPGKRPRIGPASKIGRAPENEAAVTDPEPPAVNSDEGKPEVEEAENGPEDEVMSSQESAADPPEEAAATGDKRKSADELPEEDNAAKKIKLS